MDDSSESGEHLYPSNQVLTKELQENGMCIMVTWTSQTLGCLDKNSFQSSSSFVRQSFCPPVLFQVSFSKNLKNSRIR